MARIFAVLMILGWVAPVVAQDQDPKVFRRKIDVQCWRINLSGIAATYLDYKAQYVKDDAAKQQAAIASAKDLRENMLRLEKELNDIVAEAKKNGSNPFVNKYLKPTDKITYFQNQELSKTSVNDATRLLGTFVSGLRAGSRARVIYKRGSEDIEDLIDFDEKPKELMTIVQVADLIPGEDPTAPKEQPRPVVVKAADVSEVPENPWEKVFTNLRDPAKRSQESDRKLLFGAFAKRSQQPPPGRDFAYAMALTLSVPESHWRLTFDRITVTTSNGLNGELCGTIGGSDDLGEIVTFEGEKIGYRKQGGSYLVTRQGKEIPALQFKIDRKLTDPALAAYQKYLDAYAKPDAFTRKKEDHVAAAASLAGSIKSLREHRAAAIAPGPGTGPDRKNTASLEILEILAQGHLSEAAAQIGAENFEVKKIAETLGYVLSENKKVWGSKEAVQIFDYASLRGDAAKGATLSERHLASNVPALRYLALYFKIRAGVESKKSLGGLCRSVEKAARESRGRMVAHLTALSDGIEKIGRCRGCDRGNVVCEDCDGRGKSDKKCENCEGDGKIKEMGDSFQYCKPCKATGTLKDVPCKKCRKAGSLDCASCDTFRWLIKPSGSIAAVFTEAPCGACNGQGVVFPHVARICELCSGFGLVLTPTLDESATLR